MLSRLDGLRMADCDRRCWCRSRAGMTGRPLAADTDHDRETEMARRTRLTHLPGRCSVLRSSALALTALAGLDPSQQDSAIRASGGRGMARGGRWFGRMR